MDHDEYWHYAGEEGHALKEENCKICQERDRKNPNWFSNPNINNKLKKSFWKVW
jgi:hypothetical protein